jgi:hypothetical protein
VADPVIDLRRLWRDVHAAPESSQFNLSEWLVERQDHDALKKQGLYHMEALAEHDCLFLLGRPGAGKTSEIARIASGAVPGFAQEQVVVLPCREIGPEIDLEVRRDSRWRRAIAGIKPVRLVLDGLDEGFLRNGDYFARLKRALEALRSEFQRLRLILVCRPAEWDSTFGESVNLIWARSGKPPVFALEPLTDAKQRVLGKSRGVEDVKGFSRWVLHNNFEEFAAWPRSLEWLADQFQSDKGEMNSYTDLCRRRVERGFGEDQRIEQAGRADRAVVWTHAVMLIAAAIVFCGKKGVALDGIETDCLTFDEMFRESDVLEFPNKPPLTRESVREAVRRASHLMEVHGSYHRFQNQSDLEYLAAAMLASLKVEQLTEVFGCPDAENCWRVFPQLATTAANLAGESRDFFEWLLVHDPRVLMRVDFASKPEHTRRTAIEAILKATAAAKATGEHDHHAHFTTLRHPHIEEQLQPWVFDKKKSFVVRDLAFDIAMSSCGSAFWAGMAKGMATGNDRFLESRLPSILMRFGKDWPIDKLREFALSEEDEIAGAAMNVLLDRGWTAGSLAPFLREPSGDVFGAYDLLLSRLIRECSSADVPPLLDKISAWSSVGSQGGAVYRLAEALVSAAIPALDQIDVREALTAFLISHFQNHDSPIRDTRPQRLAELGLHTTERRRSLLLALVAAWPPTAHAELLPFSFPILRDDFRWLLEEVSVASGTRARILATIVGGIVWKLGDEHRELLERAFSASVELRAQLPPPDETGIFETLERLRSEAEEKQRARENRFESERRRSNYSFEVHFAQALEECRAGRLEHWTNLCVALSQPKSEHDDLDFLRSTDIRQLTGWKTAAPELRSELTQLARNFLMRCDIPAPGPRQVPADLFGIVYALSLHAHRLCHDPELRASACATWVQAILRHCGSEDDPLATPLTALTALVPGIVAEACGREFSESWMRNETIFGHLLSFAWCDETEAALIGILENTPLQPETYTSGLTLLFTHRPASARSLAGRRLEQHLKECDSAARRAAIAACLFIVNDLWTQAWPVFIADVGSARQLVLEYSRWLDFPEQEKRIAEMPTAFIAGFYGFMVEGFPLRDMPRRDGAHFVGPLEEAYRLQQKLQLILEARGRRSELKLIYARNNELRGAWWLGKSLEKAESNAHALRRNPPDAASFIRLLATRGGMFVCDNNSLQRAVLASLKRFEKALHPDGIVALWEAGRPRSEEVLQIEIARHLRREFVEDEIVVNMETKVERRERSDIRVQAGKYVVTIEVKLGHSEDRLRPLRKAMRTQLRDSYLANSKESHGIYVVGWFFSSTFRPGGQRDLKSIAAARRYFRAQAQRLSTEHCFLEAFVIDCSLRESAASRGRGTKRARQLV